MAPVKKNYIAAAAIASPSTTEGAAQQQQQQQHLEELNRRLVVQKAQLRKQIMMSTTNLLFTDSGSGAVVNNIKRDDGVKPEHYSRVASDVNAVRPLLPDVDCFYSIDHVNAVAPLLPTDQDCIFSMDDIIAEKKASAGRICWREVEDAVERKWMESAAFLNEQFLRMEDRLVELEEEGERSERRFMKLCSDMEEGFRKLQEEGERRETRIRKLEEEGERRETLLSSTIEELVSLKRRLGQEEKRETLPMEKVVSLKSKSPLQEEKNNVAAAGKKKRGWIKWIPTAILVTVGVVFGAKSSK